MNVPPPSLETLRRRIDEIDDAIHDLVMRRAEVVREIAALKNGGGPESERVYVRPGREASILRRLVGRHAGDFPLPELTRMWREMITGFTRLQGPFTVAVHAPEGYGSLWDLARDQYGSHTPMLAAHAPLAAIRTVLDGTATIAVLPWPEDNEVDPWWRALTVDDRKAPRVVGRLPFVSTERSRDERIALAVAQIDPEPTGDDHGMIAVELTGDLSRSRLKLQLDAAGLPALGMWGKAAAGPYDRPLYLVEIANFVALDDPRLVRLREGLGDSCQRIKAVGGFAVPIQCKPGPSDRF